MRSRDIHSPANLKDEGGTGSSAAKENSSGTSPMHAERLKRLYASMLKCRMIDNVLGAVLSNYHSIKGREAVIAGCGIHLLDEDLVAPCNDISQQLFQANRLTEIFKDLAPAVRNAQQTRKAVAGPSAGGTFNMAAGMALAGKMQKDRRITLCAVHNLNADSELWREAVSFASAQELPIVFVVAQFANELQQSLDVRSDAQKFLPAITVDGSDAVAVYRVAEESIRRGRQGLGPSLIECLIEDIERDPLRFMENYLGKRNLWSDSWKVGLVQQFTRELDAAMKKHVGKSISRDKAAALA